MGLSELSFSATNINYGKYADRPTNPKPGDLYICTDLTPGAILFCTVSGEWDESGLSVIVGGAAKKVYHEGDPVKIESYAQVSNGVFRRLTGTAGTSTFKKLIDGKIYGGSNLAGVWQTLKTYTLMLGDIYDGKSSLYCKSYHYNGVATARILVNDVEVATGSQGVYSHASAVTPATVGDVVKFQVKCIWDSAPELHSAEIRGDVETINILTYE